MNLNQIQEKLNKLIGKKEDLQAMIAEDLSDIEVRENEKENITKCMKVLSFISENNQEKIISFFEHTISSGLKDIFDLTYMFKFDLKTRGDSSSCDFEIQSSAFPGWSNIVMCRGKSIQEVVAVIFRFILVKLDKKSRKILILDEVLSGLEKDRQALASKFLLEICKRFKIQLIVISHNEDFTDYADKTIDLNRIKNRYR